jgi:hypothetical protein
MAKLPDPPRGLKRFFNSPATYDLMLGPIAVIGGWVTSYGLWLGQRHWSAGVLACATVITLILGLLRTWVTLSKQIAERSQASDLEASLHTLHAILVHMPQQTTIEFGSGVPPPSLRITIHRLVKEGEQLEQVVDYVGDNRRRKNTAGRHFSATSGIIGKAVREREPQVGRRVSDDREKFVKELILNWGYTDKQARSISHDSRSWMAIPLFDPDDEAGPVMGVLFLDSVEGDFFNALRQELAKSACIGIARFVQTRYR